MRKVKRMRRNKKIAMCLIVALLMFLVVWIKVYPWENEQGTTKKTSDKVVENTKTDSKKENSHRENKSGTSPEEILSGMTITEKVYQMCFVSPEQITSVGRVTAAGEATKQALKKYPVGGIMYSKPNLVSQEQVSEVITNSQNYSKIHLFIATDEEGGVVNRLMDTLGTTKIDSMYTYKEDGTKIARKNAETIASDMKALGFNMDFAPVADVWSNPNNTVIGKRAYSDDFNEASKLVKEAVGGFKDEGIICTLKHFPGHGDTAEDTHTSTAYLMKKESIMEKEEYLPFKAGIEAGADFVMVGHMVVSDIEDTLPASLSEKIVTDILREKLGFEGVIITDALNMAAVTASYSSGEAAVLAVKAGNDMILLPENLDEAVNAIVEEVNKGGITEEQIDKSVLRILQKKQEAGIL